MAGRDRHSVDCPCLSCRIVQTIIVHQLRERRGDFDAIEVLDRLADAAAYIGIEIMRRHGRSCDPWTHLDAAIERKAMERAEQALPERLLALPVPH